jgi:hypothetical protein
MSHRLEAHSRQEDWITNLPNEGFREMVGKEVTLLCGPFYPAQGPIPFGT